MDILEKNLKISEEIRSFYDKYKNSLYIAEKAKINNWTFTINNIYMHSKYDPKSEADRISDILLKDKDQLDIMILYGNGLGYIAKNIYESLIKNNKAKILPYILVIEADIKIFLTSLNIFDWTENLEDEHFKIFLNSNKETIGAFIQSIPTKRIRYYYHRPSYVLNEEYYKSIQKYIEYILDRKDMNTATFTRFQKVWTRNIILNLDNYFKTNHLNKLKNTALGLSCILVAGGPTLEYYIEFLKKSQSSAIIIAVDTVYKFLLKKGIIADILVTVDPQYWNYKYLENLKINNTVIVTDTSVYNKVLAAADPSFFFIGSSLFPIFDYFENDNESRGHLAAGGSVATSAFDVARIIGAEKILLIGLDLSFPGRMTHFKGAFFETMFLSISDYYKTAENLSYNYLCHIPLIKARSNKNTEVYTDKKMILFKKWFEREILLTSQEVLMPESGGIMIEGLKTCDLNNIIFNGDKNIFKKNINNLIFDKKDKKNKTLVNKINIFIDNAEKIKDLCEKLIFLIPENGKIKHDNIIKVEQIEKLFFSDIERKQIAEIISSSAQDILLSISENYSFADDQTSSAWIKTRLLYESIFNLSDFYIKTFKKALKFI